VADEVDAPIALYEELKDRPYSADYFDVAGIWDSSESLSQDLRAIDSYYRSKVQTGEYEDGKKTFEDKIKEA
jgi:hypothetical protein